MGKQKKNSPMDAAMLYEKGRQASSFPFSFENYLFMPGFCDVHVHLREPGFSYKETVRTGTLAAAHGGYTAVCAMPNLSPVPDGKETLGAELAVIARDAVIPVYPYGAITRGERGGALADFAAMAPGVCAFSDDGRGVQRETMMLAAMQEAKKVGKLIAAHCEDESLLVPGGCVHDGAYARAHGLVGIPSESEYRQLARDLDLVAKTGARYHACHISSKESVALIREAKKSGLDVSCETAPHYLLLCEDDLADRGCFKMNPPLRGKDDREALLAGLLDGTIDMIATDHAPHSAAEKAGGLADARFGIVGLECAFSLLYTHLVRTGPLTPKRLATLLSEAPRRRFGLPPGRGDFTVFEIGDPYVLRTEEFLSLGKSTPFAGETVYGQCMLTVCGGKTVWQKTEEN